jgi:hypothetical protein
MSASDGVEESYDWTDRIGTIVEPMCVLSGDSKSHKRALQFSHLVVNQSCASVRNLLIAYRTITAY